MDLLRARFSRFRLIHLEEIDSDTLHNMVLPKNPDRPEDVIEQMSQIGATPLAWAYAQPESTDCVFLFSHNVCCFVTLKGRYFLEERLK